nr:MAG TPA: hypothetical protein [Caudoviricetes sp.]
MTNNRANIVWYAQFCGENAPSESTPEMCRHSWIYAGADGNM